MKILFVAVKHYDANPNLGTSYEYSNFYLNLKKHYEVVDHFPIDLIAKEDNKKNLDEALTNVYSNYDFIFFFMYKNDFSIKLLQKIKEDPSIKSISWFSDDDWRYEIYSQKYIDCFDLIITTYKNAFQKYKRDGQKNVLLSQWAANIEDNLNLNNKVYRHDISFIGKNYGSRQSYIESLNKNYNIACYGNGWKNASYYDGDIKDIYNFSKINLSFSDSSTGMSFKNLMKVFLSKSTSGQYLFNNLRDIPKNFKNLIMLRSKQIKARPFQILASQNFLLCEYVKELEDYFEIGKDLDTFRNKFELEEKIKFYLNNQKLLEEVAINGKKKIEQFHTYQKRFNDIFNYFVK